jgi:PAS domain S-box-containing protein
MNQEKIKGISLFPRLLLALLTVVVLISGMLTTVFYVYSKRSLEKQTMGNIRQQIARISYHFTAELGAVLVKDLHLLASNPILDDFIMSSELEREVTGRGVERFFFESLRYSKNYESISFVNSSGQEVVKVNRSGRVRTYRTVAETPIFARIKAGQAGGIDVEGPFRDQYDNVFFTSGIYKTDADIGRFGGVVLVDHSLREFLGYLDTIKIFEENPLWVFTPKGTLLKQPATKGALLDPRPFLAKEFQKKPSLAMVDGGMLVYQDLYVNPDRPLLRLAVSIPSSLLLRDMQALLRFFLLVAVAGLIVTSIIAYYLAGYLSRPIRELAHAASRLAKGELTTKVIGRSSGEVQLLIDSFNRMSEDLQRTTVSKNYVNDILASMRDTLIVASTDGTITRINMAASFLLGYDETELVGERLGWVVLDEPGAVLPTLDTILENSSISSVEKTYLDRNGKMVPMLFSASVMRGSDGQVQGVVCVAQDMTERKKAEEKLHKYSEELQEINEELKNFAYIISHDLRAPLVNIKGFSDELIHSIRELGPILEKNLDGFSQADREKFGAVLKKDIPEALTFIGSSVSRMDNLINAVLKLSRAGRRDLSPEPVSIQDLIGTIAASLAHQLGAKNAQVTLQEGLPEVVADKTALGQIFGNLLDNAVKYLEPGRAGSIEISAERQDGEVVFHVRDNGRGMAQEDIPRAFEIFRRVGRQDVSGEGMGLAYVKTLVRSQGGRIWCESEPDKGTTFSFTLPQAGKAEGADQL